jgi:hypothetical protein
LFNIASIDSAGALITFTPEGKLTKSEK